MRLEDYINQDTCYIFVIPEKSIHDDKATRIAINSGYIFSSTKRNIENKLINLKKESRKLVLSRLLMSLDSKKYKI